MCISNVAGTTNGLVPVARPAGTGSPGADIAGRAALHLHCALVQQSRDNVKVINFQTLAATLPQAWQSKRIGSAAGATIKVVRMDAAPYPEEIHSYAEGLLVIDGQMQLIVAGEPVAVAAGEIYIVPAGVPHSVAAGSRGTLVIFDE